LVSDGQNFGWSVFDALRLSLSLRLETGVADDNNS
jgi:hypothetical protein